MGRGRAKAKQQKVARELKYNSHYTDLDALQRELGASPSTTTHPADHDDSDDGGDIDESGVDEQDDWLSAGR